ncbi:MAG: FAD-containing monooxygenase EthA [Myxococcales bacterium]|nr:FAD-containing monooxygenase EthA [Myxococcales bacterium]
MEHVDVIVVGAGLSGIGAGYHLSTQCPTRSYAILEGRGQLGGTWDLFRYPGIRSDSDMHTLGYHFKPWVADKAIADGPSILRYIRETADEHGIADRIRYHHQVQSASWSSEHARWTLTITHSDSDACSELSCNFLFMCAGYYSYRGGYTPEFSGRDRFKGPVIHPQKWPEQLDYSNKRIAIIGSGATAVTLLPALAKEAAHVVMVQRSPSYIVPWPEKDRLANALRRVLPDKTAYAITRWKNITLQQVVYRQTRIRPETVRRRMLKMAQKALGDSIEMDPHLTPSYDPWDQRLCLAPDGDFFEAIKSTRASIVTGDIDSFTEDGLQMSTGEHVDADIVVTATGLQLVVLGEVAFSVDGASVDFSNTVTYKGFAYSGVPNLCTSFGYVNASWTLRSDLIASYVCRLLNHLEQTGTSQCIPRLSPRDKEMPLRPFIDGFTPGYLQRVDAIMPKQGDRAPWVNTQNYRHDLKQFQGGSVDDGSMEFL